MSDNKDRGTLPYEPPESDAAGRGAEGTLPYEAPAEETPGKKCEETLPCEVPAGPSPAETLPCKGPVALKLPPGTLPLAAGTAEAPSEEASIDAEPEDWEPGDVILETYEVKEVFEQGGFGRVYRVHHRGWKVDLAVKSLRREFLQNQFMKDGFVRECEGWVNLGLHPHIVSCYYVRDIGGLPHTFAEFMEGGSLDDWLEDDKIWGIAHALDLALQCLDGLAFAHSKGLVHRDIKPDNCLISARGDLKVTDFGIASGLAALGQPFDEGGGGTVLERTMVLKGGAVGTPAYMPPEQWDSSHGAIGPWSDLYAFGIMLFEMLGGERPFDEGNEDPAIIKVRHLSSPPPDLIELNSTIPAVLAQIVNKCLAKKPQERYQSCDNLRGDLLEVFESVTGDRYQRAQPREVTLRADAQNNRAVSMLDLGKGEEALALLKEALKLDPRHLEAQYNESLILWRRGEISDDKVVMRLEEIRKTHQRSWKDEYLLAQVHLERQAPESALALLEEIKNEEAAIEVQEAIMSARALLGETLRCLWKFNDLLPGQNPRPGATVFHILHSAAFNTDNSLLICGGGNFVNVIDVKSGKYIKNLEGHTGAVYAVALSGDNRWALSGGGDCKARLWDLHKGECLRVLEGHETGLTDVAISGDGGLGLTVSACFDNRRVRGDNSARLWDLTTGKCLHKLTAMKQIVTAALSSDCRWLLYGGYDGKALLYEVKTGRLVKAFSHNSWVLTAVFNSDNTLVLTGSQDKSLKVWEIKTGNCRSLEGHMHPVMAAVFSADDRYILSLDGDLVLKLWEASTGKCLRTFVNDRPMARSGMGRWSLDISRDSRMVAFGMGYFKLCDVSQFTGRSRRFLAPFSLCKVKKVEEVQDIQARYSDYMTSARIAYESGDLSEALESIVKARALPECANLKDAIDLWHKAAAAAQKTGLKSMWHHKEIGDELKGQSLFFYNVNRDASRIITVTKNYYIAIWDLASGNCISAFDGRFIFTHCAVLSSDGRLVATGTGSRGNKNLEHPLALWDCASGQLIKQFGTYMDALASVDFDPSGHHLLSCTSSGKLTIMDVIKGRSVRNLVPSTKIQGGRASLSSDGRYALSRGGFGIKIWNVETGDEIKHIDREFLKEKEIMRVEINPETGAALLRGLVASKKVRNALEFYSWDPDTAGVIDPAVRYRSVINITRNISADGRWCIRSERNILKLWSVGSNECIWTLETRDDPILNPVFSQDCRYVAYNHGNRRIQIYELDWEYQPCPASQWNDAAVPVLEQFLLEHTPAGRFPANRAPQAHELEQILTRRGEPHWSEKDFQHLLLTLSHYGFPAIEPEVVREQLMMLKKQQKKQPQKEQAVSISVTAEEQQETGFFAGLKKFFSKPAATPPGPATSRASQVIKLIEKLKNSRDLQQQSAAAQVLENIMDIEAIEPLIDLFEEGDEKQGTLHWRQVAAKGLLNLFRHCDLLDEDKIKILRLKGKVIKPRVSRKAHEDHRRNKHNDHGCISFKHTDRQRHTDQRAEYFKLF